MLWPNRISALGAFPSIGKMSIPTQKPKLTGISVCSHSLLLEKVRYPQRRDSGVYECQVSTTPPVGYSMTLSVVGKLFLFRVRRERHIQISPKTDTNQLCHPTLPVINRCKHFCLSVCLSRISNPEPITTIHGSPDLYIDTGSTVNLTCIVRHLPEPPAAIQWTHNNEVSSKPGPPRYVKIAVEVELFECI